MQAHTMVDLEDLEDLKNLVRYLQSHRRLVQVFVLQEVDYDMVVHVDSNHAGFALVRAQLAAMHCLRIRITGCHGFTGRI